MHIRGSIELLLLGNLFTMPLNCFSAEKEAGQELPSKSPNDKLPVRTPTDEERLKLGENEVPKSGLYEHDSHAACHRHVFDPHACSRSTKRWTNVIER